MNSTNAPHKSVLLAESIESLALRPGDKAIDCTVGAGGHTETMLAAVGQTGFVLGIDRDESALALTRERLAPYVAEGRLKLVHGTFSSVAEAAKAAGIFGEVQGILADIGVSSMHLDQAERGFSFAQEGPLDMRMDQSRGKSAANLIAELSEEELTRIFRDYGEEPKARQIAQAIVKTRELQPITTTLQLADLVKKTVRYKEASRKHPATRVFQALRIAVNRELEELEELLTDGIDVLRPGGRLAVISFHSLEDRLVKRAFVDLTARRESAQLPRELPLTEEQMRKRSIAKGRIIKPFPLVPSDEEVRANPRARSARLRVLEKLEGDRQ